MDLFENDIINITNIYNVTKYITPKEAVNESQTFQYNSKLATYELVFFVSCENKIHFNGVNLIDKINSVRYLPKGSFNGLYTTQPLTEGYCIDIYFDTSSEMPETVISYTDMDILKEKFIKLYNVWNDRKTDYYINSMGIFYDIIRTIKKSQYDYATNQKKERITKAYEYILNNFMTRDFNYEELCNITGFSSSYFRESFLNIYHKTPTQVITKMRMEYAKELIITKRYKISQIAEMCGYDNVYYFSTVFKKYFGTSPSKFDLTL